jgi:NAD-dependent dihydropyrimidine dehydrogenase PreA subunit
MGKRIVFCNCGSDRIEPERLKSIENILINANIDLIKISDLCGVSVPDSEKLRSIFSVDGEYLVVACNSRTLKLLFEKAGIQTSNYSCKFINFFESYKEEIERESNSFIEGYDLSQTAVIEEIRNSPDWVPWFPVIDYDRCTSCGQCADFCLFGVYEKTEGKINVINPQGCKNNCPACARICPQTAIIFPKYKPGGAIGGSDVIDEISEQKRQVEDINTILNGDIYSALEQRKMKRKSIIREEEMNKAIEERLNALNNLNPEN